MINLKKVLAGIFYSLLIKAFYVVVGGKDRINLFPLSSFFCFFCFVLRQGLMYLILQTGLQTFYVVKDDLELLVLPCLPLQCWDYSHVLLQLV